MKLLKLSPLIICTMLVGCQSTPQPYDNFVYEPKPVDQDAVSYVKSAEFSERYSEEDINIDYEYHEEQNLIKIILRAIDGTVWNTGSLRQDLYRDYCETESSLMAFARDYNFGLELRYVDQRKTVVVGPWSKEVCDLKLTEDSAE